MPLFFSNALKRANTLKIVSKSNGLNQSDSKLTSIPKAKAKSSSPAIPERTAPVEKPLYTSQVCPCCGTVLKVPKEASKFKCVVCQVSSTTEIHDSNEAQIETCSLKELKSITKSCLKIYDELQNVVPPVELSKVFSPVRNYLCERFHDIDVLNQSFLSFQKDQLLNFDEINSFYRMLMSLPTRKPFYALLCACNDLMKRPRRCIFTEQKGSDNNFRWILIIWTNPVIRECLIHRTTTDSFKFSNFVTPEINAVSYELAKRCIGYMATVSSQKTQMTKEYLHFLKAIPIDIMNGYIETVNLYITFQFSRMLLSSTTQEKMYLRRAGSVSRNHRYSAMNLVPVSTNISSYNSLNNNAPSNNRMSLINNSMNRNVNGNEKAETGNNNILQDFKFNLSEYSSDWHIISAATLMMALKTGNKGRGDIKILTHHFYNMMLDFIDYRKDFDSWKNATLNENDMMKHNFADWSLRNYSKTFNFCKYPALLSLGVKIAIMTYEVRRIMEFEAEQAFLKSLDQRQAVDVYFKIRVRREYITNDSLTFLKNHPTELLKSLKVEFVNEPGIDAGGLRKEWFTLLTKSLFNPMNGLFTYNKESHLAWFTIQPVNFDLEVDELYYLFGVVMGLAIFNSTILDVRFPKLFYKKLCKEPLNFVDYMELCPETSKNLVKLLDYSGDDLEEMFGLTFETTYKNQFLKFQQKSKDASKSSNLVTVDLCPNGKNIKVTNENKHEFVDRWFNFYINESVEKGFRHFSRGFHEVFSQCKSSKLFDSEELEKLVCGEREHDTYDFAMLRSVTKYTGGFDDETPVINWFWTIIQNWDSKLQKKFLTFVSGSDCIPATGISTLPCKISRLGPNPCHNVSKLINEPLPLAHTCFNELSLWEYKSKDILEKKLYTAVTESEGFGFK